MLTNIYYYDFYRPYILGNRESGVYAPKNRRIADRRETTTAETANKVYILNKSLKNEIVDYAHRVSFGVTGLRTSTRQTTVDMENFNRDIHREGFERAQADLAEDLAQFAEDYNASVGFMETQKHSAQLRTFSYEIADQVRYNSDRLAMLGFSLSETDRLTFDRAHFSQLSQDTINIAIGENIQIFADLNQHTGSLLTEPLSEYMNFKGLSYHYNYKMGAMVADDGFSLIESGLLVDRVV